MTQPHPLSWRGVLKHASLLPDKAWPGDKRFNILLRKPMLGKLLVLPVVQAVARVLLPCRHAQYIAAAPAFPTTIHS